MARLTNPKNPNNIIINESDDNIQDLPQSLLDSGFLANTQIGSRYNNKMFQMFQIAIDFLRKNGIFSWEQDLAYNKGSYTRHNEKLYVSYVDNNTEEPQE